MARKLLCEYGPVFFRLSTEKEKLRRRLQDLRARPRFASCLEPDLLPCTASAYTSPAIEALEGVTLEMQQNKVNNMALAVQRLNGLLIRPGEVFSFWRAVGDCTPSKGYRPGLIMANGELVRGYGGGLCQLANHIHNLVLGSPLTVVELHHHSDALFPDTETRIPYELGTSVLYNYVDYRFCNTSGQDVQLHFRFTYSTLFGELRSQAPFPFRYRLVEEDHHFAQEEDGHYYRNSRIYRIATDNATGMDVDKELVYVNHSRVMFDPALLPPEQIRTHSGGDK